MFYRDPAKTLASLHFFVQARLNLRFSTMRYKDQSCLTLGGGGGGGRGGGGGNNLYLRVWMGYMISE